jgi:hypothetical protein
LSCLDQSFGNYGHIVNFSAGDLVDDLSVSSRRRKPTTHQQLAQTCKSFHQELNHLLYHPVRLRRVENARHFANTISSRPDLASLVKEVRHSEDVGFSDFANYSEPFYAALPNLQNLQTLVMRQNLPPSDDGHTPQAEVQAVFTDIYYQN